MNSIILIILLSTPPIIAGEPLFTILEVDEEIPKIIEDEVGSPTNPSESVISLDDLDLDDIDLDEDLSSRYKFLDIGNKL